jgi:hypothetical protein
MTDYEIQMEKEKQAQLSVCNKEIGRLNAEIGNLQHIIRSQDYRQKKGKFIRLTAIKDHIADVLSDYNTDVQKTFSESNYSGAEKASDTTREFIKAAGLKKLSETSKKYIGQEIIRKLTHTSESFGDSRPDQIKQLDAIQKKLGGEIDQLGENIFGWGNSVEAKLEDLQDELKKKNARKEVLESKELFGQEFAKKQEQVKVEAERRVRRESITNLDTPDATAEAGKIIAMPEFKKVHDPMLEDVEKLLKDKGYEKTLTCEHCGEEIETDKAILDANAPEYSEVHVFDKLECQRAYHKEKSKRGY